MNKWQNILWREWRHTSDLEFAKYLFNLVAHESPGWGAKISVISLYTLTGTALGILLIAPITLEWAILQYLALAGAIVGSAWGVIHSRQYTWHKWLRRLEANTPADHLNQLLGIGGLVACVGSMVFGPILWIMIVGMFWLAGDMILWINRSIETTSGYNPEDRRWWFWWRKRPYLSELETALQQACHSSPAAQRFWSEPLQQLAIQQHQSVTAPTLVNNLFNKDWLERFIARHKLVRLNQEAVPALQEIADNEDIPLHKTAQWLLQNIIDS